MATIPKAITIMQEKTSIVDADLIEIVDSAEANKSLKNKKVLASTLKAYSSGATVPSEWVPTSPSITFSRSEGTVYKSGRTVILSFDITWPTTADTNTGIINGLPIKASQGTNYSFNTQYMGSVYYFDNTGSTNVVTSDVLNMLVGTADQLQIMHNSAPATNGRLNSELTGKRVIGTITYIAES